MKAKDIEWPRPNMGRLPSKPGKLRRYLRSTTCLVDENAIARDFLMRNGLSDQIAWALYPPHYKGDDYADGDAA